MNPYEHDWKNHLEKLKMVQKCPRCNGLSLKYAEGKIICGRCGYEQNVTSI